MNKQAIIIAGLALIVSNSVSAHGIYKQQQADVYHERHDHKQQNQQHHQPQYQRQQHHQPTYNQGHRAHHHPIQTAQQRAYQLNLKLMAVQKARLKAERKAAHARKRAAQKAEQARRLAAKQERLRQQQWHNNHRHSFPHGHNTHQHTNTHHYQAPRPQVQTQIISVDHAHPQIIQGGHHHGRHGQHYH